MDEVHGVRDREAADIVMLIRRFRTGDGVADGRFG